MADDLGWADLACYGGDLHQTPHLDRLAQSSVRFTSAYAAASVCSPTRAALMTGQYPARLHMTVWYEASLRPPQDRPLIPPRTRSNLAHKYVTPAEVLRAAGYRTAHVGKWHLGDAAHYPETQGFDVNIGGTFWGAPPTFFYPYRGDFGSERELRYVPGLHNGREGEYLTDRLTDEALHLIDAWADEPFFLHLAYHAVHTPIEAPSDDVEHYQSLVQPGDRHQNPVYAAMVHRLDENVGRLLARLDALRIRDNTLVIFTSDNGGYINPYRGTPVTDNYPLRSGKGSLYEGGIRVPLMIRWPGVATGGGVCDEPVVTMDLYATILAATGQAADADQRQPLDGTSLAGLLANPDAALDRDALYFHYPHYYPTTTPVSAVRAGRWKLLEYFEDDHVELYDLENDLGETHNLAGELPDRAAELTKQLHAWREATAAQLPEPNPAHAAR